CESSPAVISFSEFSKSGPSLARPLPTAPRPNGGVGPLRQRPAASGCCSPHAAVARINWKSYRPHHHQSDASKSITTPSIHRLEALGTRSIHHEYQQDHWTAADLYRHVGSSARRRAKDHA